MGAFARAGLQVFYGAPAVRGASRALWDLDQACSKRFINPAIGAGLVIRILRSNFPEHVANRLLAPFSATRVNMEMLAVRTAIDAMEQNDAQLLVLALAIDIILQRMPALPTTRASSSAQIFSLQKDWFSSEVPDTIPTRFGRVQLLCHCKYCWRLTLNERQLCEEHSASGSLAAYRAATRLRPDFKRTVRSLEEIETRAVLTTGIAVGNVPRHDLLLWMTALRPRLASVVAPLHRPGEDLLGPMARWLWGRFEAPLRTVYQNHPIVLSPSALRAEAWLTAIQTRGVHGGKRVGAGRPPKN